VTRIIIFIATNLAILLLLGIVMSFLGLSSRSMGGMLFIALVFGMGGSFISLYISKWMAKRAVGAKVIETASNPTEQWLLDTVAKQAKTAYIAMPEVAIFESSDVNAFATGRSKNNSLVAVSTGLLEVMTQAEAEAVLAHEVSHIANGDMVTMALIQGVLNTFVIFFARLIASVIDNFVSSSDEEGEGLGFFAYMAVVFVLDLILGFFAGLVVAWFSRKREFRADQGGAYLAGPHNMKAALQRLQMIQQESSLEGQFAAFGIKGKKSFSQLMMSHPPLEERIKRLS